MGHAQYWVVLLVIFGGTTEAITNLIHNPGFEDGLLSWSAYSPDQCIITSTKSHSGSNSLECSNYGPEHKQQGHKQTININQNVAKPIVISGYSKATSVAGTIPIFYGIYAEVKYDDGSEEITSALFFEGTHEWHKSEKIIWSKENKKVKTISVYATFNNHTGTAWFDDLRVAEYESPSFFKLGLKLLVLSVTESDIRVDAAKKTLDSVGAFFRIYDVIGLVNTSRQIVWKNKPLPLVNEDGTGKYYGIIATTNDFVYQFGGVWSSVLEDAHLLQLENYLLNYPYENLGVTLASLGNGTPSNLSFSSDITSLITGIPNMVTVPISGSYTYPATIVDTELARPAAFININQNTHVGGVFVSSFIGWSKLYFFVDHALWSLHTKVLGAVWFQWITAGMYFGQRRIYLQPQIDDVFLASNVFDPTYSVQEQERSQLKVKIDGYDLNFIASWQAKLNKRLPAGSSFATEMAFNGAGVVPSTMHTDSLFQKSLELFSSFYWESHTFSHPNLTALDYDRVAADLQANIDFANEVFFPQLNVPYNRYYSPTSMVTPSISGLFSADALEAIYDSGIRNVVGDNSIAKLRPSNPYHGIVTTTEEHGFPGIFIIPRQATNIYYNAPDPHAELAQYNRLYSSVHGNRLFSLDELLAAEADVATNLLLEFRHDPYMFHQGNLKVFLYRKKEATMYTMWVDSIIDSLLRYTTLPILSVKHDDQAIIWKERMARDSCEVKSHMNIRNKKIMELVVSFLISSSHPCVTAITGFILGPCCGCPRTKVEAYGPDVTTYIALPGGDVEMVLPLLIPKNV